MCARASLPNSASHHVPVHFNMGTLRVKEKMNFSELSFDKAVL